MPAAFAAASALARFSTMRTDQIDPSNSAVSVFFISGAITTGVVGRLGDMLGKRRMLLFELVLFALGADATWPDDLARRMARLTGPALSVVNAGIGGNRVLNSSPCCGVDASTDFGR